MIESKKGLPSLREGRELFQQPLLLDRHAAAGLDEVRPTGDRAVQRLGQPPPGDAGVVAAAQHVGHLPPAEVGWAGELRLLEQAAVGLALLGDEEIGLQVAKLLAEARGLAAQASLSGALGFIGDARAVDPLLALVARKDLSASARGLAAAALGRVADEELLPWSASISCGVNYRATTPSLLAGDGTGLLEIL